MSETCEVVKVKSSAPDNEQGYYLLNKSDFQEGVHELFDVDEAQEPAKKLGVAELREALNAKGIEFPEGAKKAELQALLDA
jgi:hypothetical protein